MKAREATGESWSRGVAGTDKRAMLQVASMLSVTQSLSLSLSHTVRLSIRSQLVVTTQQTKLVMRFTTAVPSHALK